MAADVGGERRAARARPRRSRGRAGDRRSPHRAGGGVRGHRARAGRDRVGHVDGRRGRGVRRAVRRGARSVDAGGGGLPVRRAGVGAVPDRAGRGAGAGGGRIGAGAMRGGGLLAEARARRDRAADVAAREIAAAAARLRNHPRAAIAASSGPLTGWWRTASSSGMSSRVSARASRTCCGSPGSRTRPTPTTSTTPTDSSRTPRPRWRAWWTTSCTRCGRWRGSSDRGGGLTPRGRTAICCPPRC